MPRLSSQTLHANQQQRINTALFIGPLFDFYGSRDSRAPCNFGADLPAGEASIVIVYWAILSAARRKQCRSALTKPRMISTAHMWRPLAWMLLLALIVVTVWLESVHLQQSAL